MFTYGERKCGSHPVPLFVFSLGIHGSGSSSISVASSTSNSSSSASDLLSLRLAVRGSSIFAFCNSSISLIHSSTSMFSFWNSSTFLLNSPPAFSTALRMSSSEEHPMQACPPQRRSTGRSQSHSTGRLQQYSAARPRRDSTSSIGRAHRQAGRHRPWKRWNRRPSRSAAGCPPPRWLPAKARWGSS